MKCFYCLEVLEESQVGERRKTGFTGEEVICRKCLVDMHSHMGTLMCLGCLKNIDATQDVATAHFPQYKTIKEEVYRTSWEDIPSIYQTYWFFCKPCAEEFNIDEAHKV